MYAASVREEDTVSLATKSYTSPIRSERRDSMIGPMPCA